MLPKTVMVAKKATNRLLVSNFDLQAQPSYGFTQPDDEGVQLPIAYESRKLTASERKYSPYALEMLAVVHAFKAFRHYLLGAPGAPGLRAGQVLPPFRASVRGAGSPTDGFVQPRPGARVDG